MTSTEQLKEIMKNSYFFAEMDDAQLDRVADLVDVKTFADGEIFEVQGKLRTSAYIILKGSVRRLKDTADGGKIIMDTIGESEVSGFLYMFMEGYPVSASLQSAGESLVGVLPSSAFYDLVMEDPEISLKIINGLAKELRNVWREGLKLKVALKKPSEATDAAAARPVVPNEDMDWESHDLASHEMMRNYADFFD